MIEFWPCKLLMCYPLCKHSLSQHPGWDRRTLKNDIAMIKLISKVEMNQYVKTVDMAPAGADYDGQTCTISGWGVTSMGGGSLATTLQVDYSMLIHYW